MLPELRFGKKRVIISRFTNFNTAYFYSFLLEADNELQQTPMTKNAEKPQSKPLVLVFAGNDPTGGAGIQADI